MENAIKRFLSLALALVMVFGMLPVTNVFAESETASTEGQSVSTEDSTTPTEDSTTPTEEQSASTETTAASDEGDTASTDPQITSEGEETVNELIISTADELLAFATAVTDGDNFAGKVVKLGADIDLNGIEWAPIGGENVYFAGEFDGQGKTISNLTQTTGARMGLFGLVEKAYIHDLTMKGVSFTVSAADARVGAIAGNLQYWNVLKDITIDGITVTINGNDGLIGSVAGYAWKSQLGNVDVVNAVYTVNGTGNVIGGHTAYGRAHVWDTGVTGNNAHWLDGTVQTINGTEYVLQNYWEDCDVTDITITLNGTGSEAGGFFGSDTYNSHSNYFVDCHVSGLNVTAAEGTSQTVGGFIAWNNGTTAAGTVNGFDGCSVSGTITGADGIYGGFVGQVGGRACSYYNASADVNITCTGTAGGFAGATQAYSTHKYTFTNCSATGDVTANVAGGFIGKCGLSGDGKSVYVEVNGCSASGAVSGTTYAGGLIGEVNTELPATNWNTVDSTGELTLEFNTAATNLTGGTVGALIGYLDGVANGDAKEGNKLQVTLLSNVPENGINRSEDTPAEDIVIKLPPVAMVGEEEYESLQDAVTAANAVEGGATVTLLDDVTLGEKLTISGNVTISGEYTITRADDYTGTLFTVNAGATLTLDGGLVIDGANDYSFNQELYNSDLEAMTYIATENAEKYFTPETNAPVATAYMIVLTKGTSTDAFGGTVNLNDVTIQNNYSINSGIVNAAQYTETNLNGAKITHVAATQASGVVVNASGAGIKVNMNEGTVIDGNHVGGNHGIFKIYSGTVFTMKGGEVKNTTGWNSNGSVVGLYGGTFVMNGGTICSNSSVYGPNNGRNAAIYLHSNSVMEMNGGTICHNTGRSRGGIDSSKASSTLTITGGEVLDNISLAGNSTADVGGTVGTWEITGGTFTQDVSAWLAPDTGLVYDEETGIYSVTEDLYEYNGTTYKSLAAVIAAIKGGVMTLSSEAPVVKVLASHKIDGAIAVDTALTLDLNGMTITTAATAAGDYKDAFTILADVTVTGNGTVDARPSHGYTFYIGDKEGTAGTLTIENGTFYGETSVVNNRLGTVTINGGSFAVSLENEGDTYDYVLNCIDDNYKNGTAKIVVKGGKFYKFNPADNASEVPNTNFVADGYVSEADGDYYTVRVLQYVAEMNGVRYESLQEAIDAANGETVTIKLIADIVFDDVNDIEARNAASNGNGKYCGFDYGNGAFVNVIGGNVTVDLNGYSITYDLHDDAWCNKRVVSIFYVTDKANLTVTDSVGTGAVTVYGMGTAAYSVAVGTKVTIEGGTWTWNPCKTCSATNAFLYASHGGELYITGGKFVNNVDGDAGEYMIFSHYSSTETTENSAGVDYDSTKIEISGGTFANYNPAQIKYMDQGNGNAEKLDDGCALGYVSELGEDGNYVVEPWNYEIYDKDDLLMFAEMAASGEKFSGKTIKLLADIDLSGAAWTPIKSFAGTFDGGKHTISNFSIDATAAHGGFFNVLEWATVKDLTLEKVTATVGSYRFGTLARSINQTNIDNVTIKNVEVTTTNPSAFVAGLFCHGTVNSNMEVNNCTVEDLTVNAEMGAYLIGGITAFVQKNGTEAEGTNILENLHVKKFNVVINDTDGVAAVGGLVGQTQTVWQNPRFNNCSVSGLDITASGNVDVGGFMCYPGSWTYAEDCTVEGKIDVSGVTSASNCAGGFFGNYGWGDNVSKGDHKVTNCTADVDIITKIAAAGGFVGSGTNSEGRNKNITLTDCVAKGAVTCVEDGTANIGGFAGETDRGIYINCSAAQEPFIGSVADGATLVNTNSYVAQVGKAYYAGVDAALAAAQTGDDKTVTLLSNAALTNDVEIAEAIVLNSGEYALTCSDFKIILTKAEATLTAAEGLTVTTSVDGMQVVYEGDVYKVAELPSVAKIGETEYKTLQAAIDAATAGNTIIFLADITENVTVNKSVTIDGDNFKYTGTMTANAGLTVTVQNVNFVNGGIAKSTKSTTGTYTIKNCTFDGEGTYAYPFTFRGANKIVIEDCTVKDYLYSFLYVRSGTNSVSVKNVSVEDCPNYAVYFASGVNSATFENLTVKNSNNGFVIDNTANRVFTIKDCKLENVTTAINHANGDKTITCTALGENDFGTATISEYAKVVLAAENATLTAAEGQNVTTNIADHKVVYEGDTYKVVAKNYVAQIGETKYESLQEAINAAQTDDTVIMLKDVELTEADCVEGADRNVLLDVAGKDITLNMDGHKISVEHLDAFTNDYIVAVIRVADGAGLTVTGNGTIDVNVLAEDPDMAYMFWKRGTTGHLTVENGTFHMNDSADSMVYTNGNEIVNIKGGTWTLDAYGTRGNREPWIFNVAGAGDNHVTVTGGTFNADINRQFWSNEVLVPETYYTVDNGDGTWTVKEGAVAYVYTGLLTGPYFAPKNIGYATIEEAFAAAVACNDVNITLLQDVALTKDVEISIPGIVLNANDKTLTCGDYKIILTTADATLSAPEGLKVTTELEGKKVVYENGKYSVAEIVYVAQIGEVKYESLQDAIDAAEDGDTIVVLENIDLADAEMQVLDGSYDTYFLVEGKSVTIDLNGKTISGAYTGAMLVGVFSTDNGGKLTLTGNGTVDVTATGKVYSLVAAYSDGSSIIIENGTYKLDKASDSLVYYGGKTDAEVTVKGGTFTLGNVGEGENGKPWIFNVLGAGDHHVYITGGTFNADINRQHWSNEAVVAKTHYVVDNGDGTWTVKEGAVAYVNTGMVTGPFYAPKDVGYATIEEAFAAAVAYNDVNITLLQNVTLTKDVEISVPDIVLNANGFALDCGELEIKLTAEAATLTAAEGLNVTSGVDTYYVVYADGTYSLKQYVAWLDANLDKVCDETELVYADLSEGLADAAARGTVTVRLLDDAVEEMIYIEEGVTLDLNGHTVTSEYVVAFSEGHIVDESDSNEGLLKVAQDKIMMQLDNEQLPVYVAGDGGYRFYSNAKFNYAYLTDSNKYCFQPFIEQLGHEAIKAEDSGVTVVVRLTWSNEHGTRVQDFIYSAEHVENVLNSYYYDETRGQEAYKRMYTLTFGDIAEIVAQGLTCQAIVVSDTGVEIASEPYIFANDTTTTE